MQTVVATSSMEAEYIGLCAATKMATWMKSCMDELKLSRKSRIIIGMDNQSSMMFAEEQMVQDRSTNRLPADIFTKPLTKTKMRIFRKEMGIHVTLRSQAQKSLTGRVGVHIAP